MKARLMSMLCVLLCLNLPLAAQMKEGKSIMFTPISHASFVMQTSDAVIDVDPVGDAKAYQGLPAPTIILLTDIHGDHLSPGLIESLRNKGTVVIGPKAVTERIPDAKTLNNGETTKVGKITIEAIPMYNLTKGRLQYHTKGRGNGYVVTADGKRTYISGDTEDIPEMRNLKNIDYAFVCMNLPYTMTVEQAASAVLEFKPKVVMPYHYRGTGGFSDVAKFKELVATDPSIEVRLLNWYPDSK